MSDSCSPSPKTSKKSGMVTWTYFRSSLEAGRRWVTKTINFPLFQLSCYWNGKGTSRHFQLTISGDSESPRKALSGSLEMVSWKCLEGPFPRVFARRLKIAINVQQVCISSKQPIPAMSSDHSVESGAENEFVRISVARVFCPSGRNLAGMRNNEVFSDTFRKESRIPQGGLPFLELLPS